jgi:hypothetical protein
MASEIKFITQDPPPERNSGPQRKYEPLLQSIVDNPEYHNKWILLVSFSSVTGARDTKHRLVTGETASPPANWEYRTARTDTNSDLYVRLNSEEQ